MGLDRIRSTILQSAGVEADRIVHAAEKHAAERVAAQKRQIDEANEIAFQAQARTIEDECARRVLQFNGAANKDLLDRRNACLRDFFARARKRVLSWPADEYAVVMERFVARAAGDGGGRLRVHPQDQVVFLDVVRRVNSRRRADAQIELDPSQPLTERGGFVFVGSGFEVDQTLSTLLTDIERELTPAISAALFPG